MTAVVSADDRLAAADPAITGLREVLRPLGLVQQLAPGWHALDARVVYLRYKPGTSLVAGLEVRDDHGIISFAQALALGPGGSDKLAKVRRAGEADDVGRGAVTDERRGLALADVTADRHLPGVRRVLRTTGTVLTPLVYKPGRRWVARQERAGAPVALVKVHRPAEIHALRTGWRALRGLPVSSVTKVGRRRGIVTSDWVPGSALDRLGGDSAADLWSRAGGVLAQLHHQPPIDGLVPVDQGAELSAAVCAVRAIAPELTAAAQAVADRVGAGCAGSRVRSVVHGDFSADQVIVRPDLAAATAGTTPTEAAGPGQPAVTVVDLDRVGLDDPVADLASWYGAHVAAGAEPGDPRAVLAPLIAGYVAAGGPADLERLRLHCAGAVLLRATEPFRRQLPDWPTRLAQLVTVATELAA